MKSANQSVQDYGAGVVANEDSGFSYQRCWVMESDAQDDESVIAGLMGYPQTHATIPDMDRQPDFLKPIVALERQTAGAWYIHAIATKPGYRCRGFAAGLLDYAKERANENGCEEMALVVNSENKHACDLYERAGFLDYDKQAAVSLPGLPLSGNWVLMKKTLEAADAAPRF